MASPPASAPPTVDPAGFSEVEPPPRLPWPRQESHGPGPASLNLRVGAGVVDLVWIGIPTVLVARMTGESLTASSPSPSSSTSQLEAVGQTGPWHLNLTLADHVFVLSAGALALTVLTMILATVVATVVVPLLDEGRTPGMAVFRLRIVAVDRRRPTLWTLTVRMVGSALDLMPVVVPGLVGFAFAASNPRRQRIGDRLARTTVVHEPRTPERSAAVGGITQLMPPHKKLQAGGVSTKPKLGFAAFGGKTSLPLLLNPSPFRPDLRFDTIAQLSPGLAGVAVASPGWMLGDSGSMTNYSADITSGPASAGQALDRPPVADRPVFNPYPKPQRPQGRQQPRQESPAESQQPHFAATSGVTEAESGDSPATQSARSPEWNDDWQSWVYWDDERRQWLRFDSEIGEWEPMS